MRTRAPLQVGSRAPMFAGMPGAAPSGPHADLLASRVPRGSPLVLVFARGACPAFEGPTEERIRAELRGLGATLVILSSDGVWSIRPDDDRERMDDERAGPGTLLSDAGRAFGVDPERVAVFVIDTAGIVRFSEVAPDGEALPATLAAALREAGRGLCAQPRDGTISRREWVVASLAAAFAVAFGDACARHPPGPGVTSPIPPSPGSVLTTTDGLEVISGDVLIRLHVNGADREVEVDPRVTLLDALRERLGLTGTKKGCDHGQCGACTVLVDGRRVNACLTLALGVRGAAITTIEGLADGDTLHPVQAAFVAEDAFQCGYCTPGQILSAVALLQEGHAKSDDEVREQMSGNICRCGAYPNIVTAVQRARSRMGVPAMAPAPAGATPRRGT